MPLQHSKLNPLLVMGSCNIGLTIEKKDVVAAMLPVQEHWLPMSNLDLLLPPLDVGVFFCYKENGENNKMTKIQQLKKALSQALVSFYALAGEIVENNNGEPELLCNNRGVDFVQAYLDMDLKEIDLYRPDVSVQGNLVPVKKNGVLCVQVTGLRCGGLVIGCTFDHRVADAHSANMFFIAWAELTQEKSVSFIPSFRRSILNPRRPCFFDSSVDSTYALISSLPKPPTESCIENSLLSRIYYVPAKELDHLQSQASNIFSNDEKKRSKLESLSAFLWKIIAQGCQDNNKRCKMGIVVDGRKRFKSNLYTYFGNALSIPYKEASVGEINEMSLSEIANIVHTCIKGANKEEHFRGLIDWVELHRPSPTVAKAYHFKDGEEAVVVSSGRGFPVTKMDFGFGKLIFGSYHFPWNEKTGFVMPMPSTSIDGDWVVYMYLARRHIQMIEKKETHIFRPMTPTYLNFD